MLLLDKMFRSGIRSGALEIVDHDGHVSRYGDASTEAPVRIRFTRPDVAGLILRKRDLGAGEAFMDGGLTIDPPHDIRSLVELVTRNMSIDAGLDLAPLRLLRRAMGWIEQINTRDRAARNVRHHYELSRRFYELFLDTDRHYTMAYFRDPADTRGAALERAQQDKAALIASKLRLGGGMRVLDIGCGWGGFALYLQRQFDVEVVGISLAPDQVAFARERAEALGVAGKVQFHLLDYRDAGRAGLGRFDRITSIGMFEHVGAPHFERYFAATRAALADDGVMLTHTIGRMGAPARTSAFTRTYIFPGGYIPALGEMTSAMERNGWMITDVEVLRRHYAWTLREWYRRTVAHRVEIEAMFDARLYRMWLFYLAGAEMAFRHGRMANFQVQSTLRNDVLPVTRDYMGEAAQALFAANRTERAPPALAPVTAQRTTTRA